MAGLRRLMVGLNPNPNPTTLHASLVFPSLLLSCRGIASKLFVGGLSFQTTEDGLTKSFSEYGQVVEAKIVTDRQLDRSKGFGFVTFASVDEADEAITEMNGKVLDGRTIFVDYAKPDTYSGKKERIIARGPPPQQTADE